jgi:pimeloyl-ACP methyl ester carboxylesterase
MSDDDQRDSGGVGEPTPLDLTLPSGRLRAHRSGDPGGPTVIGIPGLSSNSRAFDALARRLAADGRCVVALDLRGRGRSDVTGAGTYGWPSHAQDVLAAAAALGADPVDLVGHSMGAFVAMQAAAMAPVRVRRIVLIDAAGPPEEASLDLIRRAVERLGAVLPSADAYVGRVRELGSVVPWSDSWERSFRYELEPVADGVRARTSQPAVMEDYRWGAEHDARDLWPELRCPVLVVRAGLPIVPDGGFILRASDRDALLATVAGAEAVEVEANHYGVLTHRATADAVSAFLGRPEPA